MKSVLISIQPKWVEKMCEDEKSIEVRKTRPKLETPFKCYIYETKAYDTLFGKGKPLKLCVGGGKVIGEFVCDRIYEWTYNYNVGEYNIGGDSLCRTCLSYSEFENYGKGKTLYGWHISDFEIYDKPKELFDFANYDKYQVCKERNCFSGDCWICPNNAIIIRPPQSYMFVEVLGE